MKFEPGTDVMAPWGDGFLYPAVVVREDPDERDHVLVAFWDGDGAVAPVEDLHPLSFEVGMRVFANHLNQNNYQAGTIVKRLGGALQVELKNGSMVWTTWAKCRIEAPEAGAN
jgi:hypothetical protein